MLFFFRPKGPAAAMFIGFCLAALASAAEKPRLHVDDYQIAAELLPEAHKLSAHATVKVTALEDLSVVTFQLNNALRVTKLVDANNKPLSPERITQDSSIRFALNDGVAKGASTAFSFDYEGTLENADDSPVQGLKLAYVGPDTSYLLYSGLWFPVAGYGVNRFTATISVTVPAHMIVIGSGKAAAAAGGGKKNGAGEHQDLQLCLEQTELPGHHHRGHFSGNEKRRSGRGSSGLLQTGACGSRDRVRFHRRQGVHLLYYPVWNGAVTPA